MSAVERVLDSIDKHRDRSARFYKPVCVLAALDLVNRGSATPERIDADAAIARFSELVMPLFPRSAEKGWMPFWHLTTDDAWACYRDGAQVLRAVFPAGKPKGRNQLLRQIQWAAVNPEWISSWTSAARRRKLAMALVGILERDSDVSAAAMGVYLRNELDLLKGTASAAAADSTDEGELVNYGVVENYGKLRAHLRIERSQAIAKKVKAFHGLNCTLCGFNFEDAYGSVGRGYIEAHHLVPVAKQRGTQAELDIRTDYVVLCANCHRMVHVANLPSDLDEFRHQRGLPSWAN